jgi:hypothetical protein
MHRLKLKVIFFISFLFLAVFSSHSQTQEELDSIELEEFISFISMDDKLTGSTGKQVDDIISYAKNFLGTPYHFGGTSPSGFDCSGFIYYVMGNFGMSLTRSSYGLAEFGENVMLSEVRPGDLMFFKGRNANATQVGHVALVIENSEEGIKFIHASTSRGVVIDNFMTSKYYIPRFIKAKRLDYGVEAPEDLMIDDSMKE